MTTIIADGRHLTVIDPVLDRMVRQTHKGMAHFAGTGPQDATCGGCQHWAGDQSKIGQAVCLEYLRRTGSRRGFRIPRGAMACNAFEPKS